MPKYSTWSKKKEKSDLKMEKKRRLEKKGNMREDR